MAKEYVLVVSMLLMPMKLLQACCGTASVAPENVVLQHDPNDPTKTATFQAFLWTAAECKLNNVLYAANVENQLLPARYKQWRLQIAQAINQALRERKDLMTKVQPVRMSISMAAIIPATTQTSSPQPSPITNLPDAKYETSMSDVVLPHTPAGSKVHVVGDRWQRQKKQQCKRNNWTDINKVGQ